MPPKTIRSTVMFRGDYKAELLKSMDTIEAAIEKDLPAPFVVDSILGGNNNLKVRIEDIDRNLERIINCLFWFHHDDERYGYVNIDLVMTEFGTKSRTHLVGRFRVTDKEIMKDAVLKDMIRCMKM